MTLQNSHQPLWIELLFALYPPYNPWLYSNECKYIYPQTKGPSRGIQEGPFHFGNNKDGMIALPPFP
jgi:hypothetical protein